jgi:V/A-type H+-transporting ATPase subunit I
MFGALPMRRIVLHLMRDDAERASLAVAEAGVLDPEPVTASELEELPGEGYASRYAAARLRFEKIVRYLDLDIALPAEDTLEPVGAESLAGLDDRLGPVWQECSRCEERQRRLNERRVRLAQQRGGLETFSRLDVDLSLFRDEHRFLDVRVGALDATQLERLREALGLIGFSVLEFHRDAATVQVVVVGMQGVEEGEIRPVLRAAGFHALEVPLELTGHPEEMARELDEKSAELDREMAEIEACSARLREAHLPMLRQAAAMLQAAAPFAALSGTLRSRGALVRLEGWVPERELGALNSRLARMLDAFHLESRRPLPEELPTVPSVQRYPSWIRPFADLVHGYGTPRYDEFDPTWLFAVTFTLMFGMMFGDVGHGLMIAGAAWLLRHKLRHFTRFGILAGLSSTIFGFLYGSIFGFEHIMHPLWMSPLSDPMHLLMLALFWGIGFILLATALSAWNLWRRGNVRKALLGVKGVAGLLFYLGGLFVMARLAGGQEVGWTGTLAVALPLAAILAEVWRETTASVGERVLVTFMEGFEAVMGYVSNTLSFLRVAAFSLNHAALAIAVMTLAGMLDTAGHWITIVIGNIIILVLEGGIVLIQVLRLEYYEGFARFFSGDGRAYRPLTLNAATGGRSGK